MSNDIGVFFFKLIGICNRLYRVTHHEQIGKGRDEKSYKPCVIVKMIDPQGKSVFMNYFNNNQEARYVWKDAEQQRQQSGYIKSTAIAVTTLKLVKLRYGQLLFTKEEIIRNRDSADRA